MRITKVETIVVNMPMVIEGPVLPQQGGRPRTSMDTLLVRVDTDGGVTGWGEGFGHRIFPATKAALDTLIGPMCVGRDPSAISALMDELQRNLTGVGRNGPAMYALSAIDIALWDIAGKLAGLPLYRLLGGSPRKTLPAYASLLRYGEPGAVTHYVERALKRGYRHIKLHEITVGPIQAAREAAGPDIPIMVDCNCPWTVGEAIEMAHRFMPFNLKWLEEPVWPPEDHARAGARAGAGRHPDRGGRERDAARVQGHARSRRDHLRAAQRDQGGRRHADAQGDGAGGRLRNHRRAAFRLLRPGSHRLHPLHRRPIGRQSGGTLRRRFRGEPDARRHPAGQERLPGGAARPGAGR